MAKMIQWLKSVHSAAKARAEIVVAAKGLMGNMSPDWQAGGCKPDEDVALLLMRIGLIYLQAVYQGQMAAQNVIRSRQAQLN